MGSVQLDGVAWVALYTATNGHDRETIEVTLAIASHDLGNGFTRISFEHIANGWGWKIAKLRRARNRQRRNGWLLSGTVPGTFRLIAPARATRGRIAA